ncbi:MAG TPA: hypothetical protein VME43_33390 [Bryobacteraceae bacterium]|nr:hypothetical protein [Bryobacteraceae bacterium]
MAVALAAIPLDASTIFINGTDEPLATYTPFSDTIDGITATFSSGSDPLAFETNPTTNYVDWGSEMLSTNTFGATLTITFSQSFDWISIDFGTYTADPLELVAYLGRTQAGSPVDITGTQVVTDGFYQSTIGLSGVSFDTIVLSDPSSGLPIFGVGNITVAEAPEPGYFWIFPAVGICLAMWKRRS